MPGKGPGRDAVAVEIEIFSIIATVYAVTGVVLNNRKDIRCFAIWGVSNILCAMIHYRSGLWGLLVRDLIFLGLAYAGWSIWSKNAGEKKGS